MKYLEVFSAIETMIINRKLRSGARLPSIRALSDQFGYNKATIIRAFEALEAEHKIYSIPKSGYYVIGAHEEKKETSDVIDFSLVTADNHLLPHLAFKHSINRATEIYRERLYEYGHPMGLMELRETLEDFLTDRNIYCTSKQLCVVSGIQQAIHLLVGMMNKTEAGILIEIPSYRGMIDLLSYYDIPVYTVNRTEKGLDLTGVEESFKNGKVKYFYTMSRFHNPLGHHLSQHEKETLVRLAHKYHVYIIEDDYLGALDKKNRHRPLYYYDNNQQVIYLRSFSKTFMPGLRIGVVVLPEALMDDFVRAKACSDLNTSILAQASLELYLGSGMYEEHLNTIVEVYGEKHAVMSEQLKYLDPEGLYIRPADEGFIFWLNLGRTMSSKNFCERLKKRGVLVTDGSGFHIHYNSLKDYYNNGIRISIATNEPEEIRHGIRIIYDELQKLTKSHKLSIGTL